MGDRRGDSLDRERLGPPSLIPHSLPRLPFQPLPDMIMMIDGNDDEDEDGDEYDDDEESSLRMPP